MTIDLEKLQEMWEKDSKIDRDNLHEESLNIPSLHAKYFELYNTIFLLRKKAEQQRKNIRHERYEYFSGNIQNPFPKILMFIFKILFLRKYETRIPCKNIWTRTKNYQLCH